LGHLRRRFRVLVMWLAIPAAGLALAPPSQATPPRASGDADDRAGIDFARVSQAGQQSTRKLTVLP